MPRSTLRTPYFFAMASARALASAMPLAETSGYFRLAPWSSSKPASRQPMVPARSATTLLGMPALRRVCAPMMLRVRPAQLTTTVVFGDGAMSWMR